MSFRPGEYRYRYDRVSKATSREEVVEQMTANLTGGGSWSFHRLCLRKLRELGVATEREQRVLFSMELSPNPVTTGRRS